tara:strand:+ start:20198 stop:20839 length:642 start_codon:yes stop_codon:yes gene_type:complete
MFPPVRTADEHGVVGVGADIDTGTVLDAYRSGMFPMPLEQEGPMAWWSPDPRGVLRPAELSVSRSLRTSCRRYEIRIDTAFSKVMAGCADPSRDRGWIDHRIIGAYQQLHALGWAHSVEAWDEDGLAGGLYGVAIGGLFAGESMFQQRTDASKAALVGLVDILGDSPDRLIDVQWCTDHLASLGAIEVTRDDYLSRLPRLLSAEGPTWPSQRG